MKKKLTWSNVSVLSTLLILVLASTPCLAQVTDAPAAPDGDCVNAGLRRSAYLVWGLSISDIPGYCIAKNVKRTAVGDPHEVCNKIDFFEENIGRKLCDIGNYRDDQLKSDMATWKKLDELTAKLDAATAKLEKLQRCVEAPNICATKQ